MRTAPKLPEGFDSREDRQEAWLPRDRQEAWLPEDRQGAWLPRDR